MSLENLIYFISRTNIFYSTNLKHIFISFVVYLGNRSRKYQYLFQEDTFNKLSCKFILWGSKRYTVTNLSEYSIYELSYTLSFHSYVLCDVFILLYPNHVAIFILCFDLFYSLQNVAFFNFKTLKHF